MKNENGTLEKVKIVAYAKRKMTKETKTFFLPLNPENYSKNFKIETDKRSGHGNEGTDPRYKRTASEELKLEFILDGTGAIENYHYNGLDTGRKDEDKSVKKQLELFLATTYHMDGKIHRPNFLKVHWGEYLTFQCVLSGLDINYQLFKPGGDPLRAKLSATFLEYKPPEEREARSRKNSPDLTHIREITASDRLDLMTHDIYNDTKHLLQIAKVNGLATFRQLDSGIKLRFPPIDKTGEATR